MKNMKFLIGILVSIILTIGIGNAYKLNASEVTYDKKNTTLENNTVSGAVNELGVLATTSMSELKNQHELIISKLDEIKSSSNENYQSGYEDGYNAAIEINKPVLLKTITGTSTVGVAAYEGWQNLTVDNFIVEITQMSVSGYAWKDGDSTSRSISTAIYPYFTKSYDSSTGILTATLNSTSSSANNHGNVSVSVDATVKANVYLVR